MKQKVYKRSLIATMAVAAISCTFLALILMVVGGISYANPHLDFTDLFNVQAFQKMIYIILPNIN